MIGLVSGLMGGLSARVMAVGGMAVAVVLVLLGAYRKGVKAAEAADQARVLRQVKRNLDVKQEVEREILDYRRAGGSVADRLRQEWSRDDGPERL